MVLKLAELERRDISGKGLLLVPAANMGDRAFVLYVDVFRLPTNEFLNFNYNPPQSRYGVLVFLREGYVQHFHPIQFPYEEIRFENDLGGQSFIALKCAYQGILESFVNLGTKLNLILPTLDNQIKAYSNLENMWDEVRLVCYGDSAITLTLNSGAYEECDDGSPPPDPPPPPPPNPPPNPPPASPAPPNNRPASRAPAKRSPVPPGSPVIVSRPYSAPDDQGNTSPYKGDVPPRIAYKIVVVGSSYGGGCFVYPDDDIYVTLTDIGSGNYAIVDRGGTAACGGFNFWVKDTTDNRIIYTNTSPGKSLHLVVTPNG